MAAAFDGQVEVVIDRESYGSSDIFVRFRISDECGFANRIDGPSVNCVAVLVVCGGDEIARERDLEGGNVESHGECMSIVAVR